MGLPFSSLLTGKIFATPSPLRSNAPFHFFQFPPHRENLCDLQRYDAHADC